MMHHITRSAVAAVAALAASVALAEDAKLPAEGDAVYPYGHSGAWYVFADTTGGTCMTEKVDDAGNVVQIGMTKDGEHAYLAVYALIPEDLREKREKITITAGDMTHTGRISRWKRHNADAYSGGVLTSDTFDFAAQAETVTEIITFPNEQIEITISLEGSAEAITLTKECIAAQTG
ncbi:MAG: hypothetical protein CML68_10755 [Rhodobacteraceae bacterium]|nr:hypothetical protein [Paracoccaceae bacterium]